MALVFVGTSSVRAAEKRVYNVPAQALSTALIALAKQADISIGLLNTNLTNRISRPLEGADNIEGALGRLLADTGLGFEQIDQSTWRIFELTVRASVPVDAPLIPLVEPPIEQIMVTAAKRTSTLQTTPISIAALTGATLSDYGLRSASDMTSFIAGLTSTNRAPGRNKFMIRGLSDGPFNGNTQSTVGVYIDEMRAVFNAPDPNLLLFDIDRVEVVRGPQGSLYGAGSIAGLVRLITRQPVFGKLEAAGVSEVAVGSAMDASRTVAAMLNVPLLEDRLAARAVVYAKRDGGYVDNARMNQTRVNKSDTGGARGGMRLQVSQDWALRAGVVYQSIRNADTSYYDTGQPRLPRLTGISEPGNNIFLGVNAGIDRDLGWSDLTASIAWIVHRSRVRYDASEAIPHLLMQGPRPTAFDQFVRYNAINHETRLVSRTDSHIKWLAGAFFSHRDDVSEATLTLLDRTPANVFYSKNRADKGTEIAVFGEATYTFDVPLSIIAGLRVYRSSMSTSANNAELIDIGPSEAFGENQKSGVTPKAGITYRPDLDTLLYAEVTQGFRLGGINIGSQIAPRVMPGRRPLTASNFDSDRLWNFEIGSKSTFLDQTASINATAFYAIWRDMQADLIRANGLSYTANVGDVRNYGFELEGSFAATERLHFMANVSWSNPTLSRSSGALTDSVIERLPVAPKLSGAMVAQYTMPLRGGYSSDINLKYGLVGETRLSQASGLMPTAPAYHVMDVRFSLQRPRQDSGQWKLSAYIENLTDNRTNIFAFGNPFSLGRRPQIITLQPRTFGMGLEWRY